MVMRLRQETNDYAHPHPPIFSNSKLGSGKLLKKFGTKTPSHMQLLLKPNLVYLPEYIILNKHVNEGRIGSCSGQRTLATATMQLWSLWQSPSERELISAFQYPQTARILQGTLNCIFTFMSPSQTVSISHWRLAQISAFLISTQGIEHTHENYCFNSL